MAATDPKRAFMLATGPHRRPVARWRPGVATFAIVFLLGASVSCSIEEASPWSGDQRSAVRLLAAVRDENGASTILRAGLEIKLSEGWKTYWRYPGDSGVPPRFDFSRSDNVEAVTVLWPAPTKFDDGAGGNSLGYHDQVVLPLRVVAKNTDKPVTLRADVNYAVCEKLCIPVEASAELAIASVASTEDSALFAAL